MEVRKKQDIPMTFDTSEYFKTQKQRDEEIIEKIDISLVDDFQNHPFKIIENAELEMLKKSISECGIMNPAIIRQKEHGRYEMISGHRRKYVCQQLNIKQIPCIIKNLSDDEATIFMVDSNLQREKLLPSEKAHAYKMKQLALSHQGKTSVQFDPKLTTEKIGKEHGDSSSQVKRYIRLTNLIPELLEMVDNHELGKTPKIGFSPSVEISFLTEQEQKDLLIWIESEFTTPSLAQAQEMKRLSLKHELSGSKIREIMSVQKGNQKNKIGINEEELRKVIPSSIHSNDLEDFIIKAVNHYTKYLKKKDLEKQMLK